jgi:hypothetical protein
MDLLEEIACDEFDFIQDTVNFGVMLCTRDFDRVNIDCNDYISGCWDVPLSKYFAN